MSAGIHIGPQREPLIAVRAIRGAVQIEADDAASTLAGTAELVATIMRRNMLVPDAVISLFFTATSDLRAAFPAQAARELGLTDVPLLCATEIEVLGAPPRIVRAMFHVETELPKAAIQHVYLGGAAVLRPDLSVAHCTPVVTPS
jgi:chorismate mutase